MKMHEIINLMETDQSTTSNETNDPIQILNESQLVLNSVVEKVTVKLADVPDEEIKKLADNTSLIEKAINAINRFIANIKKKMESLLNNHNDDGRELNENFVQNALSGLVKFLTGLFKSFAFVADIIGYVSHLTISSMVGLACVFALPAVALTGAGIGLFNVLPTKPISYFMGAVYMMFAVGAGTITSMVFVGFMMASGMIPVLIATGLVLSFIIFYVMFIHKNNNHFSSTRAAGSIGDKWKAAQLKKIDEMFTKAKSEVKAKLEEKAI